MENRELQATINDFIDERLEESRSKISDTKEYQEILTNSYNLFDKIEAIVNNTTLTDDYKSTESELSSMQLQEAYKIGFKDSITIFLCNEI